VGEKNQVDAITNGEQYCSGRGRFVLHHARTGWMLLSAMVAVIAGVVTLNLILTDSGMAILNHHLSPLMSHVTRLTRQA
jgi:hypothetical protein